LRDQQVQEGKILVGIKNKRKLSPIRLGGKGMSQTIDESETRKEETRLTNAIKSFDEVLTKKGYKKFLT
jgi:hypothetical protein